MRTITRKCLEFRRKQRQVDCSVPPNFNNLASADCLSMGLPCWRHVFRIIFAQPSTSNYASMSTGTGNTIYFYVIANGITYSAVTLLQLPLNQWTHVACRWTATTQGRAIFFSSVQQLTNPGGPLPPEQTGSCLLRTRPGGSSILTVPSMKYVYGLKPGRNARYKPI